MSAKTYGHYLCTLGLQILCEGCICSLNPTGTKPHRLLHRVLVPCASMYTLATPTLY